MRQNNIVLPESTEVAGSRGTEQNGKSAGSVLGLKSAQGLSQNQVAVSAVVLVKLALGINEGIFIKNNVGAKCVCHPAK